MGKFALAVGRTALTEDRLEDALHQFSDAKDSMSHVNFLAGRWYIDAEFAIASNRATSAAALKHWAIARIDSRFTL
jgi:hypothetical protein